MATSTIKKAQIQAEDVTNKLNFTALYKKAVKINNVIYFWAELYFQTYIADYSYEISVEPSIRPTSGFYPLSAQMTDVNFTPKGFVFAGIGSDKMWWRANSTNGNYLLISGSWVI